MGTQDFSGRASATPFSPSPLLHQQVVDWAESCLRHNPYLALKNVQCDFHEGVLTLRGCLPTYYLKQMANRTPMVIVLKDGDQIRGTIAWYDRTALKVHRPDAPNILLMKDTVKYMYKQDDDHYRREEPADV